MRCATRILSGTLVVLLYINDFLKASKFGTSLYADDSLLMLADKELCTLENRINDQIELIDNTFGCAKINYYKI